MIRRFRRMGCRMDGYGRKGRMETRETKKRQPESGERTGKKWTASGAVGVFITILGGVLWGLSGSCGQYLFEYKGVTSKWLVPIRLMTAGITMLLWYVLRERGQAFRIWKKRRDAVDVLIYGIAGLMLCQFSYFSTIELSNAGTATVIQYISPVIIVVLVCMMERRMPKIVEVVSLALAVAGIFVIATHGNIRQMVISKEALVMGLISAATVVLYNMQPRRLLLYYPTPYLLGWGMTIGGAVLALLFRPWEYRYTMDAGFLLALMAIIYLGSMVAFSFYMQGVKMIGPARASLYACVEPIAATVLSAVWLKVPFTAIDFLGFAMIIATILMLGFADLRRAEC